jgi:YbbR domain-containing protein
MSILAKVRAAFTNDLGLKSLALVFAVLAFLYSHGEQSHEATFVVPVEYLFPPDLVLLNDEPLPDQVVIVASGSRAALTRVQERQLQYVVDLEKAVSGTTEFSFRKPPSSFPEGVRISTVSPAMIQCVFDEQARVTVPVQLRLRGALPPGFVETDRSILPPDVLLVGARSELTELSEIPTRPLRLENYAQGFDGELPLDTTGLHLLPESATTVGVQLVVEEVTAEREFGAVPVGLTTSAQRQGGLVVEPSAALLTLRGPVPVLDVLRSENLRVEVGGAAEALPAVGEAAEVRWMAGPRPEGALGVVVRVDHPRSDRIEVLAVRPSMIALRNEGPPPKAPGEGAAPEGEESP